jgi:RNA polymerase sigma-70 factor (ECF subfamily)
MALGEAGRAVRRRDAQRDFFTAHYPRLAGWVRRQVYDDETAHDIASEAFARLMSRWSDSYDQHAYLYKTAVNLLRDHWRRAHRERRALRAVVAGQRHGPDDRPDRGTDLRALLEPLPTHQRTAILLHYLAGFSVREVSMILGRPEGTVKSDLYQARARLRVEWGSGDD